MTLAKEELKMKQAVVESARQELETRERVTAERASDLETVTRAIEGAEAAFATSPDEKRAVALSMAQHHVARARGAHEASIAALARAREIHASASLEHARTQNESARVARIAELEGIVASFDDRADAIAQRLLSLVEHLRVQTKQVFDALVECRAATAELAQLTGVPAKEPDGVRFAISFLEHFRMRGKAITETSLATFLPSASPTWIAELVSVIVRGQAAPPASPGALADQDALLTALRTSKTFADARHAALVASMGHRPPVPPTPLAGQMRVGRSTIGPFVRPPR